MMTWSVLHLDTTLLTTTAWKPLSGSSILSPHCERATWRGGEPKNLSTALAFYTGTNVSRIIGFYVSLGKIQLMLFLHLLKGWAEGYG